MNRHIIISLALIAAVTACEKRTQITDTEKTYPLHITAAVSDFTKATDTSFEENDQITVCVFRDEEGYEASRHDFRYSSGAWNAIDENEFYYGNSKIPSSVYAYYPVFSGSNDPLTLYPLSEHPFVFTVQYDQSLASAYTHSDFMFAKVENVYPSANPVNLQFCHMLSKFVINVDNQSGKTIDKLTITAARATSYDGSTFSLGPEALVNAFHASTPNQGFTDTYKVIIPPQTCKPRITVLFSDGTALDYKVDETVSFSSSKERTASISISAQPKMTVSISGDIIAWQKDPEISASKDSDVCNASISEVLNGGVEGKLYRVSGKVSNLNVSSGGLTSFNLSDGSGTIYIYNVQNCDYFENELKDGAEVTLRGKYKIYKTTPEICFSIIEKAAEGDYNSTSSGHTMARKLLSFEYMDSGEITLNQYTYNDEGKISLINVRAQTKGEIFDFNITFDYSETDGKIIVIEEDPEGDSECDEECRFILMNDYVKTIYRPSVTEIYQYDSQNQLISIEKIRTNYDSYNETFVWSDGCLSSVKSYSDFDYTEISDPSGFVARMLIFEDFDRPHPYLFAQGYMGAKIARLPASEKRVSNEEPTYYSYEIDDQGYATKVFTSDGNTLIFTWE